MSQSESVDPPETPSSLPKYIVEGVDKQDADTLRTLAEYAEDMADWQEMKAQRELEQQRDQPADEVPDEWADDEWQEAVDDARDDAGLSGSKGTIATKTIDGRDYYYLQWREGSAVKSEYVAPVVPADSDPDS